MLSSQETQLMASISGNRALEHISLLASPPEKISGSEAEAEGARKIRDLFSPYVDSCELEGVAVTAYLRGRGKLEVTSPIRVSYPCQVNPISGSGKGEGILADVSRGTRADYEKVEGGVKGKIVLATGGSGGQGLLTHEARYQGAVCLLYHMEERREDLISVHGINVDFPVLSISGQNAAELRTLLSQGREVRVSFESNLVKSPGTSYNVVGTILGSQFPEEVIYLTAHRDTWFHGANDDTSGTACLLEVAKLLAEQRPKRTVRFIALGSEESGGEIGADSIWFVRGSFAYTEQHRSQLEGKDKEEFPFCVINVEGCGHSPRTRLQCTPEFFSFVRDTVTDLDGDYGVTEPDRWTSSDQICFHTLGTPTMYLSGLGAASTSRHLYHTGEDNLDNISTAALESNARVLALLTVRLGTSEELPHSLEDLIAVSQRSMEHVPNGQQIKNLLEEKRAHCAELPLKEKVRTTLDLARVMNKNIYGFVGQAFGHKFDTISDTIAKLRKAYHLIDAEGNLEQAHKVLLSIAGAARAESTSHEVMKELAKMRSESTLISRLSNFSLDLFPLFDQIARAEPKGTILSNLDSQVEKSLEVAKAWGIAFEQSLRDL
jgi:Iap family predicted aminopeptidase